MKDIQCMKIGFKLGLITKEEIISFSENRLVNSNYDDIMLDIASLSIESSINKFSEVLDEINIKKIDFFECHYKIIYYLKKEYSNWKHLQIQLIKYHDIMKTHLDFYDFEFWSRIRDDFELRKNGFSGCMDMPYELEKYLNEKNKIFKHKRLIDTIIQ